MGIKPISISLSPNTEKNDVWLSFRLLFKPWRWKTGLVEAKPRPEKLRPVHQLEEEFASYLGVKHAISFNSGRSSLMAILSAITEDESFDPVQNEVLLQAFTCNAVPNPVIWAGLKPVYIDVNENTFNMDVEDLKKKIGQKSRTVVIQHTFGLPAKVDEIMKICRENNLILIEDCAHSLGATYRGQKVGTFGHVSFFSFSRDKVISSVYGGMAVTNEDELAKTLRQSQGEFGYPSYFWIFQQLLHPVLMNWLILPTYKFLGKYLLILFQWLNILSKAVHWKEKRGRRPEYFPKRLPNALAILALNQLKKLERFNAHRREIADFYKEELKNTSFELPPADEQNYLRFTVKHPKAHEIIKKAWQNNLLIGDWYTSPIVPPDTIVDKMHYAQGSCPIAEKLAKMTLNLPTHINVAKTEAREVVNFIKNNIPSEHFS